MLFKEKGEAPFLKPKYYKSLFSHHQQKLIELNETNPSLPLNQVVAQHIAILPEFIPADKIVEMTVFLVENWEELMVK
ncbi:MAG: hypothetical protein ACI9XO_001534 [Paraglaciecola sp.]